jgi:hypothetical protein
MFALELLLDTVPEALVNEATRRRLHLVGDRLPDALTGRIGLEAHLDDDSRVDLLLLVATARQLGVLADFDPAVSLPADLSTQPAWREAARLARRSLGLRDSGTAIPQAIWLQFEAGAARTGPPEPGVLTVAASNRGPGWDVVASATEIVTVAANGRGAHDGAPSPELMRAIRRVAGSDFRVRQISVYPGRPAEAVRLLCAVDVPETLLQTLATCGWQGPEEVLERWIGLCAHRADSIHVSLELGADGVLPGVGIEVSMAGALQPRDEPRWGNLLSFLHREGHCLPAKFSGVGELGRSFEGRIVTRRRYLQGLHRIRVTVAHDGAVHAKACFGAHEVTTGSSVVRS